MNKPNFFILGAPKCGTTSMAKWLSEHPEIFMSTTKEPHYYNTDHIHRLTQDYQHYLSFFAKATSAHKIIGEASVWYLFSKEAVPNILADLKNDNLKFLVMVRNPVQMAYSLHQEHVWAINEPVKNFRDAWNLQSKRKEGKEIGLFTEDVNLLLYGETCKLGEQLNRLYNTVGKNAVHVVLLDDLKENPEQEYKNVLNFLNLSYDGRKKFTAQNERKSTKSDNIAKLLRVLGLVRQKLNMRKGLGILTKVKTINTSKQTTEKLHPEFENELKNYFRNDILLLSSLINRDLSHWLK